MKYLDKSTGIRLFLSGITKSISSSTRNSKAGTISNRLSRFYGLSVSVALGTLLVVLVLSPSMRGMFTRGGSVAAFAESITVLASDCESAAPASFTWGDTVCASVTGTPFPNQRRVVWVTPTGFIAQQTPIISDPQTDTFSLDIAPGNIFRQPGTWSVRTINNDAESVVAATFVVRDTVPKADLAIIKSGPSAIGASNNITYTITVFNRGPDDADSVTVADPAPANTTFVSATGPSGACSSSSCTLTTLAADSSAVFTYVYNVNSGVTAGTIISNTASVTSSTSDQRPVDNSATSETTVVGASTAPCTINCLGNLSFDNDPSASNPCVKVVTYATPTATGNCADPETGVTSPVTCSPPSGSPFPVGSTAVTCTGGAFTCSFQVTINETRTDPFVLNCPANISVEESSPGSGFATVTYSMPTATGRCIETLVCNPPSGSQFTVGSQTVDCTASDPSDNTATCSFTVTVTSNVCSPATLCTGDITKRNDLDQCGAIVDFLPPPGGCATVTCTHDSGSFFPVGTTPVTCTSSAGPSCTFNVIVEDAQDPTMNCPADIVVYLPLNSTATSTTVTYPTVTASDNCPGTLTVTSNPPSGSVFPVGETTVLATTTDAAGNPASCSFTVTVLYNFTGFFPPVTNQPAINTVNAGRSIPVKFSLSGNKGLNVLLPGYPLSFEVACDPSAPPVEVSETSTGSNAFNYDAGSDQYIYVWATDPAWAGTCRELIVRLADGTTHVANFKFR